MACFSFLTENVIEMFAVLSRDDVPLTSALLFLIKRTIAESKKKHEEKQMKAQQLREKLREEKALKLQKLMERVSFL